MRTTDLSFKLLSFVIAAVLFTSCGALQETAVVPDDVYYERDNGYALIGDGTTSSDRSTTEPSGSEDYADAYYDPAEASSVNRNYYDVTYRDPEYYNMSRFGWNYAGVGMMAGNPIGPGYGGYYNTGSYWGGGNSFYGYDPFMNGAFNQPSSFSSFSVGFGNGYYPGFSTGWGGGYNNYSPYGWNGYGYYDPYLSGWGGYYGPGGSYYCPGYIYGGGYISAGSAYYGHRNAMSSFSGTSAVGSSTSSGASRIAVQDPIRLLPSGRNSSRAVQAPSGRPSSSPRYNNGSQFEQENTNPSRSGRLTAPSRNSTKERTSPATQPSRSGGISPSRSTSSPSRSSGSQRRR